MRITSARDSAFVSLAEWDEYGNELDEHGFIKTPDYGEREGTGPHGDSENLNLGSPDAHGQRPRPGDLDESIEDGVSSGKLKRNQWYRTPVSGHQIEHHYVSVEGHHLVIQTDEDDHFTGSPPQYAITHPEHGVLEVGKEGDPHYSQTLVRGFKGSQLPFKSLRLPQKKQHLFYRLNQLVSPLSGRPIR